MSFNKIPTTTSSAQQAAMINSNFAQLANENVIKLFRDKDGIPNIAIGLQSDGTSRIRIAKEGRDVTTAADVDLAFNSAQNVFKIVKTGTVNLPASNVVGSDSAAVVAHNLGYIPAFVAFIDVGANYLSMPYLHIFPAGNTDAGKIGWQAFAQTDSTNITFYFVSYLSGLSGNLPIRYYIYQESAA